jgi:hypothetical protein
VEKKIEFILLHRVILGNPELLEPDRIKYGFWCIRHVISSTLIMLFGVKRIPLTVHPVKPELATTRRNRRVVLHVVPRDYSPKRNTT